MARSSGAAQHKCSSRLDQRNVAALALKRNAPGGLAQLVERLHGMQEVSGSTPLSSKDFNAWIPTSLTLHLHSVFPARHDNLAPVLVRRELSEGSARLGFTIAAVVDADRGAEFG